jgi:hypothetical protein
MEATSSSPSFTFAIEQGMGEKSEKKVVFVRVSI